MRQQRVSCPWGRKGTVMRRLMEETEHENRHLEDGVKVWKNQNEWVLVIPHSHKPYFVVTVEGSSPERAEELLARYTSQVEAWRDEA
jgi:mannose-1-phosphate guanylyltransferase/phosphomannomutase